MQNQDNINRIKPALRTKGSFAGNWGAGRRTGGSALNDIPANQRESLGNFPTKDAYYNRLIEAWYATNDRRLKRFIEGEMAKIDAQRPCERLQAEPRGAHCSLEDYRVQPYQ